MTNSCGNSCNSGCTPFVQPCTTNTSNGMSNFAFILVLFILLVICGAAYIF